MIRAERGLIVDSELTLDEALRGSKAPSAILSKQALLTIDYVSFDQQMHRGQLVIHQDIAPTVAYGFERLRELGFPIHSIIPISVFGWKDRESMDANNSSGFCFRLIEDTDRISKHAHGAFDINPMQNMSIKNGVIVPRGATHDPSQPGTFYEGSPALAVWKGLGFEWGGDWTSLKDHMHFQVRGE